jgi:hypothetical protein
MIGCGLAFGRTSLFFGRDIMIRAAGILPTRSLPVRGNRIRSFGPDYHLFDDRGDLLGTIAAVRVPPIVDLLGTIAAVRVPPIVAKNAPTFFLRMKRHITCDYGNRGVHR